MLPGTIRSTVLPINILCYWREGAINSMASTRQRACKQQNGRLLNSRATSRGTPGKGNGLASTAHLSCGFHVTMHYNAPTLSSLPGLWLMGPPRAMATDSSTKRMEPHAMNACRDGSRFAPLVTTLRPLACQFPNVQKECCGLASPSSGSRHYRACSWHRPSSS
jgi:hypothetical protein